MEEQSGAPSPKTQIKYIRPSDRSPEKDFHERNNQSKIDACLLRTSVEKARRKINFLRDEVEERCVPVAACNASRPMFFKRVGFLAHVLLYLI